VKIRFDLTDTVRVVELNLSGGTSSLFYGGIAMRWIALAITSSLLLTVTAVVGCKASQTQGTDLSAPAQSKEPEKTEPVVKVKGEISPEELAEFRQWVKKAKPKGEVIVEPYESEGEAAARRARELAQKALEAKTANLAKRTVANAAKNETPAAPAPPATSPPEQPAAVSAPETEETPPEEYIYNTPEGNTKIREPNGLVTLYYRLKYHGGPVAKATYQGGEAVNIQVTSAATKLEESSVFKEIQARLDTKGSPPESIRAFPERNTLVITAAPEKINEFEQLLTRVLDRPQPQVEIAAKVVELINTQDFELGVNINFGRSTGSNVFFQAFQTNFPPQSYFDLLIVGHPEQFRGVTVAASSPPGATDRIILTEAAVRALVDTGHAQIVSEPRVAVKVGQTARIKSTRKVPTVQTFNFANYTATQVTFKDVGVKLFITPITVSKDTVTLHVVPEVSNVIGYISVAPNFPLQPDIQSRFAETTLTVPNESLLTIAGLDTTEETESIVKVPLLGDIPILGFLFKSIQQTKETRSLIFYIRPTIEPPLEVVPEGLPRGIM